jgi:hypothetical protein
MLAAELKIPLEIVEKEKPIGEFSADLVAKIPDPDSESEEYVVIENPLEDTDHDHSFESHSSSVESNDLSTLAIIRASTGGKLPDLSQLAEHIEAFLSFFGKHFTTSGVTAGKHVDL